MHKNIAVVELLPDINHVTNVGNRDDFFVRLRQFYPGDQRIHIVDKFIHPALLMALGSGFGVNFGTDGNTVSDITGFGLGTAHTA